ncbi:MAG: hypothetical protein JWM80_2781, partial [Cyanobacteria bacterium RYN_339]|nr:hypothetical protein [Cyanobacteria bacterium RYN_339]
PPPPLPLRGITLPPASTVVLPPPRVEPELGPPRPLRPAWAVPSSISFPQTPNALTPSFDLAQPTGLAIGLFGLGNPRQQEVAALTGLVVAAQTYLLEDGHSLFFQTAAAGNLDIWRYDMRSRRIDRLAAVNTDEDEADFALTLDARWLVFARGPAGKRRLARADLKDPRTPVQEVPRVEGVAFPSVSADGSLAAYGKPDGDIEFYDFARARVVTPPFINSPAKESFPWLLPDGHTVAFVSDRSGNADLYFTDLDVGMVEALALANSPATELAPAYIGGNTLEFVSDRAGPLRMYTYDWVTRRLDTLPY